MAKNSKIKEECGSEIEQLFRIFDRDGDGYITHAEMKRALGKLFCYAYVKLHKFVFVFKKKDSFEGSLKLSDLSNHVRVHS